MISRYARNLWFYKQYLNGIKWKLENISELCPGMFFVGGLFLNIIGTFAAYRCIQIVILNYHISYQIDVITETQFQKQLHINRNRNENIVVTR